ncbi:MAG: NACHT domain-containing protein [Methylobacter sp.]
MTILATIIFISLLLLFFTAIFAIYVWWKKTIFTREKFAFAALSSFLAFMMFLVACIFSNQPPWLAFIGLIKQWQGLPYEPPQALTTEQQFLTGFLVLTFLYLITYLHSHWDGAKSIKQYNREQNQDPQGLVDDSLLFLQSIRDPQLLAVYKPEKKYSHTALRGADDNFIWHEQARELIELSSKSYDFSEDQWHDQQRCWVGVQKHNNNFVVLACFSARPDDQRLTSLLGYSKKLWRANHKDQELEIIVAVKDGEIDETCPFDSERYSIRTVSESRLLDNLVDFSNYFREIRKRVEQNKLSDSGLTIADMYTVSKYRLKKDDEPQTDLEGFLDQWLTEQGLRQVALLGEYGQGKSTTSLMFSYTLICRFEKGNASSRIPILLELRGKSPRTLEVDELLAIWSQRYGIDSRALIKLMQAGRLLTIFEGFDEVDLSGDADARIEHFKVMWRLCYPKAKILITGRPNYFLDDSELKCALGINEQSFDNPYCQAVYLAPFGMEEIATSLRNLDVSTRDSILQLAKASTRFYDIISRPSMLYAVSVLQRKGELEQYQDRINSAVVMDLFIFHNYQRQSAKGKKPNFMPLNIPERAFFMEGIAAYMLVKGLPNQINSQQLDEAVRLLLDVIPDSVSLRASAVTGEPRKLLRDRLELHLTNKLTEAIDYIKTDVRTCGLLVSDLSRSNSFKFGHKSFMEFLAGKVFAQWCLRKELDKSETESSNALINKLGLTMRDVTRQPEVMDFSAQWIAEKAKNHNEAAKLLFSLQFKTHNVFRRLRGEILRRSFQCLPYFFFFPGSTRLAKLSYSISFAVFVVATWACSFNDMLYKVGINYPIIIRSIRDILFINFMLAFLGKLTVNDTINYAIAMFNILGTGLILVFPLVHPELVHIELIPITLYYSSCIALFFVYVMFNMNSKEFSVSSMVPFVKWRLNCQAAGLEQSAMIKMIGEKSLNLMDEALKQSNSNFD